MRRLVATVLGVILLAAPAVTLACRWSCAEPATLVAHEACHEASAPAVSLTGAKACDEHPAAESQGVLLTRVALILPMLDTPVVMAERSVGLPALAPVAGHAFSPPRPPLALRI